MHIHRIVNKTIFFVAAIIGFPAQADSCFRYPAVAMTPYDESISKYHATHSRVYHKQNETGYILLYGPVQVPPSDFDSYIFETTIRDSDGIGDENQVIAQLRFVDNNGGIHIIHTLRSNEQFVLSDKIETMREQINLDVRNDGYYIVRIYIQRSNANANLKPAALGYSLCSGVIIE